MRIVDLDRDPAPESSALDRITREAAFRLEALPLRYEEGRLVIALAEPPTRDVRREILKLSGRQPEFVLANTRLLADAIERWYPHPSIANADLVTVADTTVALEAPNPTVPSLHFQTDGRVDVGGKRGASGLTPTSDRVVAWLLAHAADAGATAVHLVEEPPDTRVRASVDGRMPRHHRAPAPRRATSWSGACSGPAGSTSTPPDRRAAGSIPRCPVSDREFA